MRLIDADALLRSLPDDLPYKGSVRRVLMQVPEVDACLVIMCKDCKYWQDNNDGYPHEECRWGHGETPNANDFCSYGERREDRPCE